jgi:hypothetical protein
MGRTSNFHYFFSKELHYKKNPKKRTFMLECYNLIDPINKGLYFNEVGLQEGNFKILQLFF